MLYVSKLNALLLTTHSVLENDSLGYKLRMQYMNKKQKKENMKMKKNNDNNTAAATIRKQRNGLCVTTDGHISAQARQRQQQRLQTNFLCCVESARSHMPTSDEMAFVQTLANYCHAARLPEEACVHLTNSLQLVTLDVQAMRKIFRLSYAKPTHHRTVATTKQEAIARQVGDFVQRRYQLRYNTLKGIEEFLPNDGISTNWQTLDDRQLNHMAYQMMLDGCQGWRVDLQVYMRSAELSSYNPIAEFLDSCPTWNRRTDHILRLAQRIPTTNPHFPQLFRRWFLAMVAQWKGLNPTYGNTLVPLLIGPQGTHKTTFCRLILPPCLSEYFVDDIKLDNAEQVERMLCRMALVNIDEYNAKTDREQAKIKRVLSEHAVQVRRMRSEQYILARRVASFIATTNDSRPLTDATGSRRYLCCPVTAPIHTTRRINYPQLYAQALYLLAHGEQYWLTAEEEQLMQRDNQQFTRQPEAAFLLSEYYEQAPHERQYLMTTHEIYEQLRTKLRPADLPSLYKLSQALRADFPAGASNGRHGYYVKAIH